VKTFARFTANSAPSGYQHTEIPTDYR